jgi:ketosteroid isomerase-like protein
MNARKAIFSTCILLVVFACNRLPSAEVIEQEIMEADRAFSDLSSREGMNKAFLHFAAEDAVLLRENSMPQVGKEALKENLYENDDSVFTLTWEPLFARAASSGDMGYSYGIYTMKPHQLDTLLQGTYVSIWIKKEGEWRWVLDTGNQGI